MRVHRRKKPGLSHSHSPIQPPFSILIFCFHCSQPFAHLYLIHTHTLFVTPVPLMFHSLTLDNCQALSPSPVCFSICHIHPIIPLSLCLVLSISLSLHCRCLTVTRSSRLLFYFNLTLLFRNRHPHALAILLAPFHFSLLFFY